MCPCLTLTGILEKGAKEDQNICLKTDSLFYQDLSRKLLKVPLAERGMFSERLHESVLLKDQKVSVRLNVLFFCNF